MNMKLLFFIFFTVFFTAKSFSQAQYEIIKDEKHPEQYYFKGIINKYVVQNDTSFSKWYKNGKSYYKPDTATLSAFERAKANVQFVVFGGTWCEDTQAILPKFFTLQEMSGVADSHITFFGVDRTKKTIASIADAFNVINVPTIIIMKNGKEAGRVVEYGKTGKWDKELADIINSAN
jgi:thiol-disulfide isomerase/thioredoxin